jgi:hypothetical protein
VGHPVKPLPDMRRADATSRKTNRPHGVAFTLQVCRHNVEPVVAQCSFNLFANDCVRSQDSRDPEERLSELTSLVSKPAAFACRAERLAR